MRLLKRIGLGLAILPIVLLALGALATATGRFWQREWAPPDNGVNLTPRRPILKMDAVKPGSAFDLLQQAVEAQGAFKFPPEFQNEIKRIDLEPWSNDKFPTLAAAAAQGAEVLSLARRASVVPDPQVPTMLLTSDPIPSVSALLRIADLFRISAAQKSAAGDVSGAFAELETGLRFFQIVSRGGALIHLLLEVAGEARICSTMRKLTHDYDVPPDAVASSIAQLLRTADEIEPLGEIIRAEARVFPTAVAQVYQSGDMSFSGLASDSGRSPRLEGTFWKTRMVFGSTAERTNENFGGVFQELVRIAESPYSVENARRIDTLTVTPRRPVDWIRTRDPIGLLLARLMLPAEMRIFLKYHSHLAELRATATLIALRRYERDRGKQAETLNDLVPAYLPSVPLDPFDEHELRYRKRGTDPSAVYSVGPNQIDEHGLATKSRSYDTEGDVVFFETTAAPAQPQ